MSIKLELGIKCTNDEAGLRRLGLSKEFIYFENYSTAMYLKLHKSEIDMFIEYKPTRLSTDSRFRISYSNNINKEEVDIITEYLIRNYKKRKYKTVSDLINSKTRLENKKRMLLKNYSINELVEYIENKKKGETVCQS